MSNLGSLGKLVRMPGRDHLFISYAAENSALADWFARRLAALGYPKTSASNVLAPKGQMLARMEERRNKESA